MEKVRICSGYSECAEKILTYHWYTIRGQVSFVFRGAELKEKNKIDNPR